MHFLICFELCLSFVLPAPALPCLSPTSPERGHRAGAGSWGHGERMLGGQGGSLNHKTLSLSYWQKAHKSCSLSQRSPQNPCLPHPEALRSAGRAPRSLTFPEQQGTVEKPPASGSCRVLRKLCVGSLEANPPCARPITPLPAAKPPALAHSSGLCSTAQGTRAPCAQPCCAASPQRSHSFGGWTLGTLCFWVFWQAPD